MLTIVWPDSRITGNCAESLIPITLFGPNHSFDKLYPTKANHCETNRTNAIQYTNDSHLVKTVSIKTVYTKTFKMCSSLVSCTDMS